MKRYIGLLLLALCSSIFFCGCGTKTIMELDKINANNYPIVTFEVIFKGEVIEGLGIHDFEIREKDTSSFPDTVKLLEENKYQVTYTSNLENKGEMTAPIDIKVKSGKKTYGAAGEFITPQLPKWEMKVKDIVVMDYPVIEMKLELIDSTGVTGNKELKLEANQVNILENGQSIPINKLEKIGDREFILSYKTSYTDRLKKAYGFTIQINLDGQKIDGVGEFIPPSLDNLQINLEQVDTHEFPKVKLYYSIVNQNTGLVPSGLMKDFFYLSEKEEGTGSLSKQNIIKVGQFNEQEVLNINMVADISGSMITDGKLEQAKHTICDFVQTVQFDIGDKIELLAFSDGVYPIVNFTNDANALISAVGDLGVGNMTCFYDALFAAINRTATQDGAKCVIAFTDGKDNISYNTKDSVIDLANRYGIPIFIVGVGSDLEQGQLQEIAECTGGFYTNIYNVGDMQEIYDTIYRQQKELYVVEYTIGNETDTQNLRTIQLEIQNNEVGGMNESNYQPKMLIDVNSQVLGISAVDDLIGEYLRGFVKAINANDFSYLKHTLEVGSPLYNIQEKYVTTKKAKEELISYEVMDKTYDNKGGCKVKVREIYQIDNYNEPLHIKIFENVYGLRQQSSGGWLLTSLDELKVVGKMAN